MRDYIVIHPVVSCHVDISLFSPKLYFDQSSSAVCLLSVAAHLQPCVHLALIQQLNSLCRLTATV